MKVGFFQTGVLGRLDFAEFAAWGAAQGFGGIDIKPATPGQAATARAHGLEVRATYGFVCEPITRDPAERERQQALGRQAIDQAAADGVACVGVGSRRDPHAPAAEQIELFALGYAPLAEYAEGKGVKLVFENWPQAGQRLAITPELWAAMFKAVPSPALGLCFDPSHLVWQGIDWLRALREFGPRVYHAHAKDTEMLAEGLYRFGVYGPQLEAPRRGESGFFRYRLPGYGVIDWAAYISTLHEVGFDGVLSIEHEDVVYGWLDNPDHAKQGLVAGLRFLQTYVV
jgi:sugar phosphate isomerase/epimerase